MEKTVILATLITAFIVVLILGGIWLYKGDKEYEEIMKRNNDVYNFLTHINELCTSYNKRNFKNNENFNWAQKWFLQKHTYEELLYSNKPLTLEEWWTKEEIDKLMS